MAYFHLSETLNESSLETVIKGTYPFLNGGGEAGALIRNFDWTTTSLGDPGAWPAPLRQAVRFMLDTTIPMYIAWGEDFTMIYNDAYIPSLGKTRHPYALGASVKDPALQIWHFAEPLYAAVIRGETVGKKDFKVVLDKEGFPEECYFDFSYNPIYLDDGSVGGVQAILIETTDRVKAIQKLEASTRQFRDMVMQAPVAMAVIRGSDFVVEIANSAYLAMLGRTAGELVGRPFFDVLPEGREQLEPQMKKVMETGRPLVKDEFEFTFNRHGRRQTSYFNSSWEPLRESDGSISGFMIVAHEITEQVLARKEAEKSEARFRSLIAAAPVAMGLFVGRDLVIEMPNQAFIDIVGKGPGIVGKPLREAMPELITENQPYLQILDDVYTSGKTYQTFGTQVSIVQNGVLRHGFYDFSYTPLFDRDGNVYAILDIAVDVTEQVLGRKRIEESEQRVRSLVESAPFPIGVYRGREMRIELANQALLDAWGRGSDVIGKLYSEVLPELDEQEIYGQLDGVFTTGIPYHAKNRRVDLMVNGRLQPFYFNYSFTPLFDASGKVYGVMNTAADVTDLNLAKLKVEENERNLRNTILQAPVAMCILKGDEFMVEIANERMLELWGKTAGDMLQKPLFTGLPEALNQGFEELLYRVSTTGEAYIAHDQPVSLPRDGKLETIYANFVYAAFREAEGTISGIMVVAVEVTEQVIARHKIEEVVAQRTKELAHANEALVMTNQELSRSNANLEEFAYAASHDMKEPIRKIHFFSDRIKASLATRFSDEELGYFNRMEAAAKRMGSLIDDLLSYSQVSVRPRVFEEVDLNHVVRQVLNDLELETEEKKAEVQFRSLPVILGHPRQIQQAFQNLISNALKFHKPGQSPVIHITCQMVHGRDTSLKLSSEEQQQQYYLIEVSDNGIGFDQHDAERIFNVFTRLHGNTEYRGTGVGLSIVRKVAENHKGFVSARSSPGEGATFQIYLPVRG
jgi:hypothetical protein